MAREYAARQGWRIDERHIYTDAAVSGASVEGRPGLQALLAAVGAKPLPFSVLLVDDSSRVSRDLADALRIMQQLRFAGVRVIYISQGIDSASEQADTLVAVHGLVDGLYLREMAAKIRRGLAGQAERGYATGAKTYGHLAVPVPDPGGRVDSSGYPVLLGKALVIDEGEARQRSAGKSPTSSLQSSPAQPVLRCSRTLLRVSVSLSCLRKNWQRCQTRLCGNGSP